MLRQAHPTPFPPPGRYDRLAQIRVDLSYYKIHVSPLNATPHRYLSINTKNPPTVDFGNIVVNAYIDVRHLDVTRLNTFKSPSIHQLERLGFPQPGRPPLRPCTIKYMETLTWVQLVGKLGNKSGAQPWVCRTAHGMRCRPAVPSWRVIETN